MGGITNPAEEYFKDGIWGWATNKWEKLISYSGRLYTALHGWDGTVWRKLPLVWGYSQRHTSSEFDAAEGAGDANAVIDEVDAGEVWVIEAVAVIHNAAANKDTTAYVSDGVAAIYLLPTADIAPDLWRVWTGRMTLAEGDRVGAFAFAPGAGVKVTLHAWGYKMKIAE